MQKGKHLPPQLLGPEEGEGFSPPRNGAMNRNEKKEKNVTALDNSREETKKKK